MSGSQKDDALNPYNLFRTALELVDARKYTEAVAPLVQVLHTGQKDSVLVQQSARMAAEIMLVQKNQDRKAIELLCFSHVAPVSWAGSTGIAAKMLQQPWSRVGDVVLDLSDKRGALLVQSDSWCKACNAEEHTQACAGCGVAYYCCKEHQVSDWTLHKYDCVVNKFKSQDLWNDTFVYQQKREALNAVIGEALMEQMKK